MAKVVVASKALKPFDPAQAAKVIESQTRDHGGLISILEEIQLHYGYLPEGALRLVAEKTGRDLVDVYGVATFYRFFSLKPRGEHQISCCLGTACHVRGGALLAEEFQRQLGVKPGENTPDGKFSLETVACLGACALGPIVVGDGHYYSNVNSSRVKAIIQETLEGLKRKDPAADESLFPLTLHCPHCNHGLLDPDTPVDRQPSVRLLLAHQGRQGFLHLSRLYGSHGHSTQVEVPAGEVTDLYCPHCQALLNAPDDCPACGAARVALLLAGGGVFQVCSRRGCLEQTLDLDGRSF
jgi:NADH:ubiquinone oxidoreductase subunit E